MFEIATVQTQDYRDSKTKRKKYFMFFATNQLVSFKQISMQTQMLQTFRFSSVKL